MTKEQFTKRFLSTNTLTSIKQRLGLGLDKPIKNKTLEMKINRLIDKEYREFLKKSKPYGN
jgi:hypothetical protein